MEDKIQADASIMGKRFPKNPNYPHPESMGDDETFGEYRERVVKLVEEFDFHTGDLSWGDWMNYCRGNYDPNSKLGDEDRYNKI